MGTEAANWMADWLSASGMRTGSRHDGTRLVGEGGHGGTKERASAEIAVHTN